MGQKMQEVELSFPLRCLIAQMDLNVELEQEYWMQEWKVQMDLNFKLKARQALVELKSVGS